jgi:hypothetical protein
MAKRTHSQTVLECKSFRAAFVEGILVVRWFDGAKPEEFPALTNFALESATAHGGKVAHLAIVSPLESVPGPGLLEASMQFGIATRDVFETTHIVLLGHSGFWRTIVRSMVTTVAGVVRKRGYVMVHDSMEAALERLSKVRGLPLAAVRTLVESDEFIVRNVASSRRIRIASEAPPMRGARR